MILVFNLAHYLWEGSVTLNGQQFLLVEELTERAGVGLVWELGPGVEIAQHFEHVLKNTLVASIQRDQERIDFWRREFYKLVGRSSAERALVQLDDNNYEQLQSLHGFDWPIPETIEWTEPAA